MPFPFLAGALSFLTSPLASTAMSAYAAARSAKAGQTDLTKLRNEANRAGFNPLTVLRATGGQGFNNTGGLSSAAFIGAFSRLGDNIAQAKQSKATLENTIANTRYTGILAQNVKGQSDPYANFGKKIPVRVGVETKLMDTAVAKRMGIFPGDYLTVGDLAEISGEFFGEIAGAVAQKIGGEILSGGGPGLFGGSGSVQNIETMNVPTLQAEKSSKRSQWFRGAQDIVNWAFPLLQQN